MTARSNAGDFPTGIFYPYLCNIASITSVNQTTLVTTIENHMFVTGNLISFLIPEVYGMQQLNGLHSYIVTIPSPNQFTVNIDSQRFDPFVLPSVTLPRVINPAQVLPVGNANSGNFSPGGIPILPIHPPGSFNVTKLNERQT